MDVGTCVYFELFDQVPEKLKKLRQMGFTSCQLISWVPETYTLDKADTMEKWLEEYGITPSALWCGYEGPRVWDFYDGPKTLELLPEQWRERRVRNLCDGADFAKALGITDVVTHMGFIPEDPNDPNFQPFCDAVRQVAEHLKENDQWLLFETGQETPTAMLRCFETVGTGNLGVNLDTDNLIFYGKGNPVDALDVLGNLIHIPLSLKCSKNLLQIIPGSQNVRILLSSLNFSLNGHSPIIT